MYGIYIHEFADSRRGLPPASAVSQSAKQSITCQNKWVNTLLANKCESQQQQQHTSTYLQRHQL